MQRLRTSFTLVLLFLPASGKGSESEMLRDLVDRHTRARGGSEIIEAVDQLQLDIRIVEPTFSVDGTYTVDRQGRMRIDIHQDGQRLFSEGYDSSSAWQWHKDAEHGERSGSDAEATLRHGPQLPIHLVGLHELQSNGHSIDYLGLETMDDVDLHVLEVTLDDGFSTFYYLDPESHLIVRSRSYRAFHPDVDPASRWHETRFSQFRSIDGQMRATRSDTFDLTTGALVSTVTIEAVRTNPAIGPEIFAIP